MKILGVDIGSYSIKIVELDANARGYSISGFFEFPLPNDANQDRDLQIIEALRGFSSRYDSSSTRWVIGVPQHRVSLRYKRFPFRERAKILKSLAFELEDDIPFDIDETIFDYKTIEFVGTQADVLTVACPKEAVEQTLSVCKDGGFDPDLVSVEGLALANCFEHWNAAPPEVPANLRSPDDPNSMAQTALAPARVILHLGHARSLLLVYREGGLVAVRSILWGGGEIANSLAATFKIPLHEAVKLLNEKSFILMNSAGATKDQITLSEAVSSQVDHLLRELKLTLLETKSAFNLEYTTIELMGGVSRIQNIGAYITQGLEISANILNGWLDAHSSKITATSEMDAVSAVALGLAIEGIKRPRKPAVNLRKGDFARENLSLKKFWEKWRLPAQVAVSAFAMFVVYSVIRDQFAASLDTSADDKVSEAALKTANLKGAAASESAISKYLRTQKDRISHQAALTQLDEYISAMDILAKITEKLPGKAANPQQGFDVTLFDIDNDDLTIKGRAANAAQMNLIQRTLSEMAIAKSFTSIGAPEVQGGVPFGFKLKVKRKQ